MKKFTAPLFALLFLSLPAARAQNGCLDSPENSTAVLGLVGCAALSWPLLRARRR